MEVIQVRNPQTFLVGETQGLLQRAIERTVHMAPGGFDSIALDVYNMITSDLSFLFLGAEDGKFRLLIMGYLPNNNLFPYPTILSFYNEGSRALRDLGKEKLLDFLVSKGYTSAWAVNSSRHRDDVWRKAFEVPGRTDVSPIGTVHEIRIL